LATRASNITSSFRSSSSEANGATIGDGSAIGTILNDDTSLKIAGPPDALEGDTGLTPLVFTISLEKASALPVSVNYATSTAPRFPNRFCSPPTAHKRLNTSS
jgi:hypothetical protein